MNHIQSILLPIVIIFIILTTVDQYNELNSIRRALLSTQEALLTVQKAIIKIHGN